MKMSRNAMIATAMNQHDERINHRGDDLVFNLWRLFLKLGEARQHEFEHAAELRPPSPC